MWKLGKLFWSNRILFAGGLKFYKICNAIVMEFIITILPCLYGTNIS